MSSTAVSTAPRRLAFACMAITLAACTSTSAKPTANTTSQSVPTSSQLASTSAYPTHTATATRTGLPGMPPVLDPADLYAADRPGQISPAIANDPAYVYVPDGISNDVYVIDQHTMRVVDRFAGGIEPQHVVPSYDLKTLYVVADHGGGLTPIDPKTGKPGPHIDVADAYNMYFTPDGKYAVVVQEAYKRLAFYDPHTWALHDTLDTPNCDGIDHMDFTADGTKALVSCEFADSLIVIDVARHTLLQTIPLTHVNGGMPQDVKLSPDGRTFYVADMVANGVYRFDAGTFQAVGSDDGFQYTGKGAHGLYISRDSKRMFVTNRGEGSITVIDLTTRKPAAKWEIPGGGSPDMGNVSADGTVLWVSGRYNGVVYAISTADGHLIAKIPVGSGPHGLCVWPVPGRYSLGHTGILR